MTNKWNTFIRIFLAFMAVMTIIGMIADGCTDYPNRIKEANEAYDRLKKQGFTDKQIYEMGK